MNLTRHKDIIIYTQQLHSVYKFRSKWRVKIVSLTKKCENGRQKHDTQDVACFRVATFHPARRRHDIWRAKIRYLQMCRICMAGRKVATQIPAKW